MTGDGYKPPPVRRVKLPEPRPEPPKMTEAVVRGLVWVVAISDPRDPVLSGAIDGDLLEDVNRAREFLVALRFWWSRKAEAGDYVVPGVRRVECAQAAGTPPPAAKHDGRSRARTTEHKERVGDGLKRVWAWKRYANSVGHRAGCKALSAEAAGYWVCTCYRELQAEHGYELPERDDTKGD